MSERLTVRHIQDKKTTGNKISMVTAYDYPFALCVDGCGIDIILVGDSLAQNVLGLPSTRDVDMAVMLHHAKAVNRAVTRALLVGDMPFGSFEHSPKEALENARRFVREAGCGAVKLEWFDRCPQTVAAIVKGGVPVMGHVGLTPQTAESFKVQGREAESARRILEQARALEEQGAFSVVLECVPDRLAGWITQELSIPTIGIGAGPLCDGQVLVLHDILGLFPRFHPKFVKTYTQLAAPMSEAIQAFKNDVEQGRFPGAEHSYTMSDAEFTRMQQLLKEGNL